MSQRWWHCRSISYSLVRQGEKLGVCCSGSKVGTRKLVAVASADQEWWHCRQAGLTASTCLHVVSLPRLQIPSDLTTAELDRATRRVLRARVRCACLPAGHL